MQETISLILAFLLGSIPFGYLISKARGIDIREHGSGNIGATNVNRKLGKIAGAVTLVLDLLKGVLGTFAPAIFLFFNTGNLSANSQILPFAGFFTILGHCYTPWLKGKGGKGVATGLGVFLTIAPLSTLICLLVFAVIFKISKIVALSSIAAAVVLPVFMLASVPVTYDKTNIIAATLTAIVIVLRHQENIKRMISGKELGFSKGDDGV